MAISDALAWRINNGGSANDLYADINNFLATNPTAEQTQAAMAQYGISPEDVAAATGGTSGGLLSGNILAGASWNSLNTSLPEQLTQVTGQQTSNYAVGGATTADTLNQLNTFLANGGAFDPNATVFLQTGGVDFLQGVDKATIKDNINQIVKTLGAQGVDVVLTGSPYASSLQDVITNNFNPEVDPLFKEIAKENKNVALVGTQGEILQNKALLVDALHTNAEGTAIYNQSVIDALSQFKNEVPSSTPQAIAQVQQTNTVATTPSVITQAAVNPVVAQSLATKIGSPDIQSLIASGALPPNQATLIGDTYYQPIYSQIGSGEDAQLGPLENVVTYKANQNQVGGNVNWYDPTGQYQQTTQQQKVASFTGGLAEMLNDPYVQAALLAGGAGGAIGNALGLTGSTAQAVGTGLFKGGSAAAGGAGLGDALKVGLLSGGLVYGGNLIGDAIKYQDVPIDFTNMTQEQINDALDVNFRNDLARAGLTDAQIKSYLANPASVYDATQSVTTPTAVTTPVADAGTVLTTAPTTPSLSNVLSTIASVPSAGTVSVSGERPVQQIDQTVLDLINSQIAANAGNASNIANVQITGQKPVTNQDIINSIVAALPTTTATTTPVAQQTITAQKPATVQEVVNAITSTLPSVTPTQATSIAEQVVTSNRPITTQEVINAIASSLPSLTTPVTTSTVPTQIITDTKPITTQDIINAIVATTPTIPSITTPVVPEQTIVSERPSSITDAITAATIPLIQPSTPLTVTPVTPQTPIDPLKVAQLGLTAAGLLGVGAAVSSGSNTGTQYPIVPVPPEWATPTKTSVAPFTPLAPINFGNRNLLIGTQWEKFLDPNYGKVPEPIQYGQPSNLSYNDLMGILGSKQGIPSASNLSINDVISGIQNQYGQTAKSTMG